MAGGGARRALVAAAAAAALIGLSATPALAAQEKKAGSELGGYTLEAKATPVSLLLYEDTLPVPSSPQGEAHLSYTQVSMETGPSGSARASWLWPGAAVGNGLSKLTGIPAANYPVKTTARYPGGPRDAGGEPVPGSRQEAHAGKEVIVARASYAGEPTSGSLTPDGSGSASGPSASQAPAPTSQPSSPSLPSPGDGGQRVFPLVGLDGVASVSKSTVRSGTAKATAKATADTVSVLGGLVQVEGLTATSVASSNAEQGKATGDLTFSGLTVAGQEVSLGGDGLEAPRGPSPSLPELPSELRKLLARLGISIQLAPVDQHTDGTKGQVTTHGLVVSVDTTTLRSKLKPVMGPLSELLPPDVRNQLAPVLGLAPRIDIVLGNTTAAANASPPVDISLPSPPTDTPPPAGTGASTGGTTSGLSSGSGAAGGPGLAAKGANAKLPKSGKDMQLPVVADKRKPASFGGVPAHLTAIGLAFAALCAAGLRHVSGFLLGAGSCDMGITSGVPDLRDW